MTNPVNPAHNGASPIQPHSPQEAYSKLPRGVLQLIFSRLSSQEDQTNVRLVCKNWKKGADYNNPIRALPMLKTSLFIPVSGPTFCFSENNTVAYVATIRDRTELTFTVLEGKIDSSIENFSSEV